MAEKRSQVDEPAPSTRSRILEAALGLVRAEGPGAATTRAVAAAAGVQVPTIYRVFKDKQGLLDAVVEHGAAGYILSKTERTLDPDPVMALRQGWDAHVAFGLAEPGLFALMSANPHSPAAARGLAAFRDLIRAVAREGRLKTSEERALAMVHACCVGVVTTVVTDGRADFDAVAAATREAVILAVTSDAANPPMHDVAINAATLRARLGVAPGFTRGERALLDEFLQRLSNQG